jgi:flagellar L-ring protein precursor FlgH
MKKYILNTAMIAAMLATGGCSSMQDRLANIGNPPPMSKIENPQTARGYQPIALPMPPEVAANNSPNSLWQPARQTFFKDQRAHKVGDILTVMIEIDDEADFANATTRARTGSEAAGVSNLLGLEALPGKILPGGYDTNNMIGLNSETNTAGSGAVEREEKITTKVAAMVTQVLPNGNFVIHGKQEVRVNFELREVSIDGVIRPEDILNNNAISYEKVAEARISYGGRGQLTDVQQPRYGQQVVDAILPF